MIVTMPYLPSGYQPTVVLPVCVYHPAQTDFMHDMPIKRRNKGAAEMKKPDRAAGPSQRQLRVGELIRHELAAILARGEIHDDVLAKHVITVPEVRMSPDLKMATCYIIPLGGKDETPVLAALDKNKRYLRSEIAQRINMKFAPDLRFRRDETFDEADRISELLRQEKVQRDLAAGPSDLDDED
jgi:ribosome-binding factor A